MPLRVDEDGFPVLDLVEQDTSLGVLPFAKWQFETLWAKLGCRDSSPLSDACYAQWLKINPRPSRHRTATSPLTLWLTGLAPSQAQSLVSHFDQGFLPDSKKWLEVEKALHRRPFTASDAANWLELPLCEEARTATRLAWGNSRPGTWAQALLLQNGILEWVIWQPPSWSHEQTGFGSLGSPLGTTFVPQLDGPRRFQSADPPGRLNGFRIWRHL